MHDKAFGRRTAGFPDPIPRRSSLRYDRFGYQPIFDSIELKIKISNYGGDTLKPMTYNVYEVISNDYLDPSLTAPAGAGSVADTLFSTRPSIRPLPQPQSGIHLHLPQRHDDRTGHGVRHPAAYARRTGAHQASDAARRQVQGRYDDLPQSGALGGLFQRHLHQAGPGRSVGRRGTCSLRTSRSRVF